MGLEPQPLAVAEEERNGDAHVGVGRTARPRRGDGVGRRIGWRDVGRAFGSHVADIAERELTTSRWWTTSAALTDWPRCTAAGAACKVTVG